jgi:hypothetical protein
MEGVTTLTYGMAPFLTRGVLACVCQRTDDSLPRSYGA